MTKYPERMSYKGMTDDKVLDASDDIGHCRWCGGPTPINYPKTGDAFTYRCCSKYCQEQHAKRLGHNEIPEYATIKNNYLPEWFDKTDKRGNLSTRMKQAKATRKRVLTSKTASVSI